MRTQLALTVLSVGLLAACGDPATPSGNAGSRPTPPATSLTITVSATAKATPQRWTLTCDPTGGTLPTAADACAFVAKNPATVLYPVPGHQTCSMIFGGPQVATVQGTWRGKPIDARLARTNGCEVARWNTLKPLVGDAGA